MPRAALPDPGPEALASPGTRVRSAARSSRRHSSDIFFSSPCSISTRMPRLCTSSIAGNRRSSSVASTTVLMTPPPARSNRACD
ncbi:MAG: hypothetical protein ACK55Z_24075, partial [bacterium]